MSGVVASDSVARRARELLAGRDAARGLETITGSDAGFTVEDGYAVADEARRLRIARGDGWGRSDRSAQARSSARPPR